MVPPTHEHQWPLHGDVKAWFLWRTHDQESVFIPADKRCGWSICLALKYNWFLWLPGVYRFRIGSEWGANWKKNRNRCKLTIKDAVLLPLLSFTQGLTFNSVLNLSKITWLLWQKSQFCCTRCHSAVYREILIHLPFSHFLSLKLLDIFHFFEHSDTIVAQLPLLTEPKQISSHRLTNFLPPASTNAWLAENPASLSATQTYSPKSSSANP